MRLTLLLAPSLVLAASLTGCAGVVHGTTQQIPIASSTPGARVLIDDTPVGVTPLVATVSRAQPHVVSFVVDSVTVDRVALARQMSPWVLADVFLLYIAPAVVDFKNGAAYNFPGDTVRSSLTSPSAGVRRLPLSPGVRASAVTSSALLGFGSGHATVDLPFGRFFGLDLTATGVGLSGIMLALGGQNGLGSAMFFGGSGFLIGSHVWQVVDLLKRTDSRSR